MSSVPHRRLSTVRVPGAVLTGHAFELPVDHRAPEGESLTVFAREAVDPQKAGAAKQGKALPWLVFLQGGPGFPAPRPVDTSGWLGRMLQEYRVLLLDQRGTGSSTPLTTESLLARGGPEAQAEHLTHFRADSIVRDCEAIRHTLAGPDTPWAVLGQSFGGFCATHYLSAHPEGLREVFVTGGLPPLEADADEVYRRTYRLCLRKNREFHAQYPDAAERLERVVARIGSERPTLPDGDPLTVRRFRQLGIKFGAKGGYGHVYSLLEEAEQGSREGPLPFAFLKHVAQAQDYDTNPLYTLLHEPIYAQEEATRWSAERVRGEFPEFADHPEGPLLFTGEMIYPWMLEDYARLRPLKEAAQILAEKADWPRLYDRGRLSRNEVPVAAAVYHDDMYVDRALSRETADAIAGARVWITNEHEHCGLRVGGADLVGRLIDMARGRL